MTGHPSEHDCAEARDRIAQLKRCIGEVIFGQDRLIELVIIGIIARGHVLLEGLPGLGKTELVKALSRSMSLQVKRIQFTPDLLPGDITGNPILQDSGGERRFVFQPGPVFANLLLADEINRASPKTQSALLEAMQERRVTVMGETHLLPDPFFVLATQNPIELEGTYQLPEAQLDRFLFKLEVQRGGVEVLERIVAVREMGVEAEVQPVLTRDQLSALMTLARTVFMPAPVVHFIARLVDATHPGSGHVPDGVRFGASPRAALGLAAAARARALSDGRISASFEDVRAVAEAVLAHRVILDYQLKVQGISGAQIVRKLIESVPALAKETPAVLEERA